jgi:hypothetical protein
MRRSASCSRGVVAHSDLRGSSGSGVRFSVPGMPHVIVLNRQQSADRMRFTLCHELGHVIMHTFPTPEMEVEADKFASCFLLPTSGQGAELDHLGSN